eukprot:scaffold145531_cov23-Tisochrysis_lutea.AAC.2
MNEANTGYSSFSVRMLLQYSVLDTFDQIQAISGMASKENRWIWPLNMCNLCFEAVNVSYNQERCPGQLGPSGLATGSQSASSDRIWEITTTKLYAASVNQIDAALLASSGCIAFTHMA